MGRAAGDEGRPDRRPPLGRYRGGGGGDLPAAGASRARDVLLTRPDAARRLPFLPTAPRCPATWISIQRRAVPLVRPAGRRAPAVPARAAPDGAEAQSRSALNRRRRG